MCALGIDMDAEVVSTHYKLGHERVICSDGIGLYTRYRKEDMTWKPKVIDGLSHGCERDLSFCAYIYHILINYLAKLDDFSTSNDLQNKMSAITCRARRLHTDRP